MKKIISLFLLMSLMTPVFASEQSVLNDATAFLYSKMNGAQMPPEIRKEYEIAALIAVGMNYATTFNGNDMINTGNLILRKVPNSKNPDKNAVYLMAYMYKAYGNAMCFEFTEAHSALNKMAQYKNVNFNGKSGTNMYNETVQFVSIIEKEYSKAKSAGFDDSDLRLKQQIRRQLGL